MLTVTHGYICDMHGTDDQLAQTVVSSCCALCTGHVCTHYQDMHAHKSVG